MLNSLQKLHDFDICHNDVKLDNFVVGLAKKSSQIHVIDLGFARKFRYTRTKQHFKKKNTGLVIGSRAFLSINSHGGNTHSRQDDLESLAYVLVNMLHPNLVGQLAICKNVPIQSIKKQLVRYLQRPSLSCFAASDD